VVSTQPPVTELYGLISNQSPELVEQVKLYLCYGSMPMEALNRIMFSKLVVKAEDLLSIVDVRYDNSWGPTVVDSQLKIISIHQDGEDQKITGALPELLRRREESDPDFAARLLYFVSGHMSVPTEGFKFLIEFNCLESKDDDSLPVSHTCDPTLKLPGTAYHGDPEKLEEKLDMSLEYGDAVGFDME